MVSMVALVRRPAITPKAIAAITPIGPTISRNSIGDKSGNALARIQLAKKYVTQPIPALKITVIPQSKSFTLSPFLAYGVNGRKFRVPYRGTFRKLACSFRFQSPRPGSNVCRGEVTSRENRAVDRKVGTIHDSVLAKSLAVRGGVSVP